MVLTHLTLVTLTFDPKITTVRLLPRTDVWNKLLYGNKKFTEGQTDR